MANITVSLTQAQFNWIQNIVNAQVLAESTVNPHCSGDITNNPTFSSADLTVAQGTLTALRAGAIL
jgi:hypothetical protein